jgi:heme/copper-type cytochrome/quinol oxidase subunit 3
MKQKISTTLFAAHKKRVEKVKAFASKNKIFVAMMIFAAVFLFINFVVQPHNQQCESEVIVCENANVAESTTEPETWRFYFIDVIILVAGGGFCTVMILRERRRTREELK